MEGITCRSCGRIIQSDASWCAYCGNNVIEEPVLEAFSNPVDDQDKDDMPFQTTIHKRWLISSLSNRERTDKTIERRWLFMPLVGTTITTIGVMIALLGLMGQRNAIEFGTVVYLFGVVVTGGVLAQLNFQLLERQDGHASRERLLRFRMLNYLRERAAAMGSTSSVQPQCEIIEKLNQESRATEMDVPTGKWTVLSYIPFLQLYRTFQNDSTSSVNMIAGGPCSCSRSRPPGAVDQIQSIAPIVESKAPKTDSGVFAGEHIVPSLHDLLVS